LNFQHPNSRYQISLSLIVYQTSPYLIVYFRHIVEPIKSSACVLGLLLVARLVDRSASVRCSDNGTAISSAHCCARYGENKHGCENVSLACFGNWHDFTEGWRRACEMVLRSVGVFMIWITLSE
jgi:hypothetical protein